MPTLTLAEALARLDALGRLSEQKRRFVEAHLLRPEPLRDPLAREGGSPAALARELGSLARLRERHVLLRRLIQRAYEGASLTLGEETRSVADWLVWKREVAPRRTFFLRRLRERIRTIRERGVPVLVHLDEQALAAAAERLEQTRGQLEGQLQLKNATLTIEAPPDDWVTGLEDRLEQPAPAAEKAPPPEKREPSPWDSEDLRRLARDPTQKIAAIKLYRERAGVGLMEAKQAVEAFASGRVV
jgi:hypothetical protein